ncbi:MAG: ribulokinase [Planctomycetota bacterium]
MYSIGLDFGTNTVRCLVARVHDGCEIGTAVHAYRHGEAGVIGDDRDPNLARQHPADYIEGLRRVVPDALREAARNDPAFALRKLAGIGVDTTASTPLPVDATCRPLALLEPFRDNLAAMAWLWKDHTSHVEAAEITRLMAARAPDVLARSGGAYSSEWFFSKILHCLRTAPEVFDAAATWVELADFVPAVLTGVTDVSRLRRGVCQAGHKALYTAEHGLPSQALLATLHPKLGALRSRLYREAWPINQCAGRLTEEWAVGLGLPPGLPVAVGAIDAHMGAVGAGIRPGRLVKIVGTSTCDMLVAPRGDVVPAVEGLCGIVDGSILPQHWGFEAGQPAVGDIFNWFVGGLRPGAPGEDTHEALSEKASDLRPGASGLLALDWNNGNRCVLADQRLTGLLVGQTLRTLPEEIYRALIEATAFGALVIMRRFEEHDLDVSEVVCCGGIAEKSPLVMQIYADVAGRPMAVARSSQTCALGAAIAGAAAGLERDFVEVQQAMAGAPARTFRPRAADHAVYEELFSLYRDLHDAFGRTSWSGGLHHVMKRLIEVRDRVRGAS